ncbi:serine/threonine-protein kinase [Frankia sp. Cr2]|uniref:serine/threonine-protein kinase n=1 Tax=Frankia sp. Cr2 TaxID=3073932 RepID=UPI002AD3FF21|nr:serine/threonine-protein kinase [Frankia sp. Cr2]
MSNQVGPYELIKRLGSGGMGEVYVAFDPRHNRKVALKLLSTRALSDPELAERFRRECQLAAQIDHPHVLPVFEYSTADTPYIAMPLVDGTDLATVIRNGPLSLERAVAIVEQIAAALDAAHRKGLRHRDVKPSNILLKAGARPNTDHAWLFDWGIAQPIDTSGAPPVTRIGQLVGTPHYVAPERLMAPDRLANGTVDHRADVYSLAVVLYECLAGRRPFVGNNVAMVLVAQVLHDPEPLSDRLPAGLRAVVAKGLAKNPDDRYQSAGELAAAARATIEAPAGAVPGVPMRDAWAQDTVTQPATVLPWPPRDSPAVPIPVPVPGPVPAAGGGTTGGSGGRTGSGTGVLLPAIVGGGAGSLVALVLFLVGRVDGPTLAWVWPALAAAGIFLAFAVRGWTADPEPDERTGAQPSNPTRDAGPGGSPLSRR